ncbi:MAG: hypothetical protein WBQ73_00375 [Candidatus Babeliales bacterium]
MRHTVLYMHLLLLSQLTCTTSSAPSPVQQGLSLPFLPVSFGEFFDKLSILKIKIRLILDTEKRNYAQKEYDLLMSIYNQYQDLFHQFPEIKTLKYKLYVVNRRLWDLEDKVRDIHLAPTLFLIYAHLIHIYNDKRSRYKREINELLNSPILEVKSHA